MNENVRLEIVILNITQVFIDVIRDSGGFNTERLLIIPEMFTELELNNYYDYTIPIDPVNKTTIYIHYIFPSQRENYFDENKMKWHYKYLFLDYQSAPILD